MSNFTASFWVGVFCIFYGFYTEDTGVSLIGLSLIGLALLILEVIKKLNKLIALGEEKNG